MQRSNTLTIILSACCGIILLLLALATAKKLTNWSICATKSSKGKSKKGNEEEHELIELANYGGEKDAEEEEEEEESTEAAQMNLQNNKIARLSEELELTKDRLQILEKKLNKLGC